MRYAIGMDVGGTKIAAGVVDLDTGQVCFSRRVPTLPCRPGAEVLETIVTLASSLVEEGKSSGQTPCGIGLAIPELVSTSGKILSFATLDWHDLDVQERLGVVMPTTVEADVRAGALAEARFGAGRNTENFLYVTVGTGISCSLVIHGSPFTGSRGMAGTFASMPSLVPSESFTQTHAPILEQFASGPAIIDRFRKRRTGVENLSTEAILAMAENGDSLAIDVTRSAAEALGNAVAQLVNTLDPEIVVFGGGLGLARGQWWGWIRSAIRQGVWAEAHKQIPVLQALLGGNAGLIGAAIAGSRTAENTNFDPSFNDTDVISRS